ncbi:MAG: GGDEF domain-containing protein [Deltaproteobacteria bacterium]|nr:GGDEF domain-containing protein [Deltaproteobacteria bacterium]
MSAPKGGERPSTTLATAVRLKAMPESRGPATPGITVINGSQLGVRFDLDDVRRNFVLGRETACDIFIDDDTVSRRHAKLYLQSQDGAQLVKISDLGSTNGVFVNEQQITEATLQPGDKIHLGDVILRFEWLDQYDRKFHDSLAEKVRQAAVDPTTGFLTKRFYQDELPLLTKEWCEAGEGYALILIDLDGFKAVNDRFGHAVGDRVLARVGALARAQVRTNDIAIRFGGDELVVVLPRAGEEDAVQVATRIRDGVRRDHWEEIHPAIVVRVSQGVAAWRTAADDLEVVFRRADRALYRAKQAGRDRVDVAEDSRVLVR